MWGEKNAVRGSAPIPPGYRWLSRRGHAAVQSIPTQLSCTRHLIHAVAALPKREGRRRRGEARWGDQVVDGAVKRIKVQRHKGEGGVGHGGSSRHLCREAAPHAAGKISQPAPTRQQQGNELVPHKKTSPFKLRVFWSDSYDWAP